MMVRQDIKVVGSKEEIEKLKVHIEKKIDGKAWKKFERVDPMLCGDEKLIVELVVNQEFPGALIFCAIYEKKFDVYAVVPTPPESEIKMEMCNKIIRQFYEVFIKELGIKCSINKEMIETANDFLEYENANLLDDFLESIREYYTKEELLDIEYKERLRDTIIKKWDKFVSNEYYFQKRSKYGIIDEYLMEKSNIPDILRKRLMEDFYNVTVTVTDIANRNIENTDDEMD